LFKSDAEVNNVWGYLSTPSWRERGELSFFSTTQEAACILNKQG